MYDLGIVSDHPDNAGRSLREFNIGGQPTVGVFGAEPFRVRLRNRSHKPIEAVLSIDGVDVITGKPATTDGSGERWHVDAHGVLELRAWPESHSGGARFVFGAAGDSVAHHVTGDVSHKGIIAASVFREGYEPPMRLISYSHPRESILRGMSFGGGDGVVSSCSLGDSTLYASKSTETYDSGPAVGAGERVEQRLQTVAGLREPIFDSVVRMKYMWWDDLVAALRDGRATAGSVPDGFPGGHGIKLGSTPRIPSSGYRPRPRYASEELQRFA